MKSSTDSGYWINRLKGGYMNNLKKPFKLNNHFNWGLYMEGLKQTTLISLISFVLINLISILSPIGGMIVSSATAMGSTIITEQVDIPFDCWHMYAIFIVVAPILALVTFNFLTKRNACDYFHSMPQKRGCVFNSYMAAIFTWLTILTVGTAGIISFMYFLLRKYFEIDYGRLWIMALATFICAALITVSLALASSLTGKLFTTAITGLLILFFPRLIAIMISSCFNIASDYFVNTIPLLDPDINLLFALTGLSDYFSERNVIIGFANFIYDSDVFSPVSIIYTSILVVIYFFLARWVFIKRASEVAGNSTSNRVLQGIFRLCLGVVFSINIIKNCFTIVMRDYYKNIDKQEILHMLTLELICIMVMFLFELISTKKLKCVLKALYSIPLLFIIQVGIFGFICTLFTFEINYAPNEHFINYVVPGESLFSEDIVIPTNDYYSKKLINVKVRDKKLNEIISRSIKNTVPYQKAQLKNRIHDYGSHAVTVGINSGGFTRYRKIRMTQTDYADYKNLLYSCDDVLDVYNTLPSNIGSSVSLYSPIDFQENTKFLDETYDILRDEIKDINPTVWRSILYDTKYTKSDFKIIMTSDDNTTNLYLTPETPKALLSYMNSVNKNTNDKGEFDKFIEYVSETDYKTFISKFDLEITIYSDGLEPISTHSSRNFTYYQRNDESLTVTQAKEMSLDKSKVLINRIKNYSTTDLKYVTAPEGYSIVKVDFNSNIVDKRANGIFFICIKDSELAEFMNLPK